MKHLFYFILVPFLAIQDISGQIELNNFYQEYLSARRRDQSFFNHISGSPYENSSFSDALVYFRGDTSPVTGNLRYNDLFDEMEMKKDDSDEYLLVSKKETIDSIHLILTDETFRYLIYNDNGKYKSGYFIQLYNDDCSLFLKRTREFQPEKRAAGYQDYVPPAIIKKSDLYFVQFGRNPLELIPQSSRRMINLFKQNGYDIAEFTEKQKTRYNAESFFGIIEYCNKQNN